MKELNWRRRLLTSSVLAGAFVAMGAPMAIAQAEDDVVETVPADTTAEGEARQQTIVVTGSRIARTGYDLTQPTEIVGSDYIEMRSLTNAADAALSIPGVVGVTPQLVNNETSGANAVGQNVVSLFNLGSQRTLTLIDGRRFVSSNPPAGGTAGAGSQVDLNNLPMGLVDRVEVVKVGGAAVYGADAVAGVVNYVLKRDFEGVELSVDHRTYGGSVFDNYADETSVRGLLGGNFDNGRGNIVLALEYNELPSVPRALVPSRAEQWTSQQPTAASAVRRSDGTFPANQVRLVPDPRAGILSVGGLITPGPVAVTNVGVGSWGGTTGFIQFDGNGGVVPYDPGVPTGNSTWASGGDGLDLALTNTTQEGYERYNTALLASYELTPDINFKTSIFRNRTTAVNSGYQLTYNSGVFGGTGYAMQFDTNYAYLDPGAASQINSAFDAWAPGELAYCESLPAVDNPATPSRDEAQERADCIATTQRNPDGSANFYLQKAWLDFGAYPVRNENNVESYHFGFDGAFTALERDWSWELNYQQGRSTIFSSTRAVNDQRWFAAMDVGVNPDTGAIDCRFNYETATYDQFGNLVNPAYDAVLRAAGFGVEDTESMLGTVGSCSPYNPFGANSQAAVDYVSVDVMSYSELQQEIVSGYLSTDSIFALPAGGIGLAIGFENRSEHANTEIDGTGKLGVSRNGISTGARGGYRSWDMYAETLIPLVSADMNVPFVTDLNIEASYRKMDNSRSGSDEAWATGVNFMPIPDIRFRANYAKTVRAPAVSELFRPQTLISDFGADPCHGVNLGNGPRPDVRRANCAAEGIPTNFVSLATNASRRGVTGGNPNLQNEQATSVNFGVVFQPRFLEGFTLSADYTKIDMTDAIVAFTLDDIMAACYDATDYPNQFCTQFVRGPDFQLPATDAYTSGFVNAALREFDVVELAARYTNEINAVPFVGGLTGGRDLGMFDIMARAYNVQTDTISNTGFDRNDTVGQHNNPEWRGDITITYNLDRLTAYTDINYQGSGVRNVFQSDPLQYIDQTGQPYTNVDAIWTMDIGAQYDLTDAISLRASVANVTDWYPDPVEISLGRGTWGRVWTIGATARF